MHGAMCIMQYECYNLHSAIYIVPAIMISYIDQIKGSSRQTMRVDQYLSMTIKKKKNDAILKIDLFQKQ